MKLELEALLNEIQKIMMTKEGMRIADHWWGAIFGIVRDAWKAVEENSQG